MNSPFKFWDGKISDKVTISSTQPTLIGGPCMLESKELGLEVGSFLKEKCSQNKVQYIFKSSFDKANRTSGKGVRGLGVEKGVQLLGEIRDLLEVPVLTDIHTPEQAELVAPYVDILQIPAFLCLHKELLSAALQTKKVVQIKKGQHTSVQELLDYLNSFTTEKKVTKAPIMLCERGSTYGYHNLVVDMRNLVLMRRSGFPTVFDATHSAQLPGGSSASTAGVRDMIPALARAAVSVGIDVLFAEVHENPDKALSDASTQLPLETAEELIKMLGRRVNDI